MMSAKQGVYSLVMGLRQFGVEDVVICPGSRNAPFVLSFAGSGLFRCHSIADERAAGFYALGMALGSGKICAVVCTSGSAGVNLAPAVVEAYFLRVPMVVITADRPIEWTDQGDGQTIRQEGIFGKHLQGYFQLIEDARNTEGEWMNRREISRLLNRISGLQPGPIHINAPLSEPLYESRTYGPEESPHFYRSLNPSAILSGTKEPEWQGRLEKLRREMKRCQRVMILIGQMPYNEELRLALEELSAEPNVVVLSESTSNMPLSRGIDTIDRLLMPLGQGPEWASLMPDLLITTGGMIVSKRIKFLLRTHAPKAHWHVHPQDEGMDTFCALSLEVNCKPEAFFKGLLGGDSGVLSEADYASRWAELKVVAEDAHRSFLLEVPWSDMKAFELLLGALSPPLQLHLANSSPVRYYQLFGGREGMPSHANRGSSGIDGCSSTAAGWALARGDQKHLLITGDVAFLYDSNALWNRHFPKNLKICVINNGGGGIFRIIPGPGKQEEMLPFFEAHHPVDIASLAKAYGISHQIVKDAESLDEVLRDWLEIPGASILEISTPREGNAGVLRNYFKHIRAKLLPRFLILTGV